MGVAKRHLPADGKGHQFGGMPGAWSGSGAEAAVSPAVLLGRPSRENGHQFGDVSMLRGGSSRGYQRVWGWPP